MDTNENTKTYSVHQDRVPALRKRLDSIARRAAKLGIGSVEYTVGPVVMVPFVRQDLRETWQRFTGTPEKLASLSSACICYRPYCEVVLNATTPKCEGWEFAATLQHLNDEAGQAINLLRVSPRFEQELPHQFRTASATNCDHCHKNISTRRDTFVVHQIETNEWKQVGRSCLCDFLGGHDPHAAARQLEYALDAVSACDEESGWGGGGSSNQNGWSIGMFLALVAVCIRLTGWVSRGKAKADYSGATKATADDVLYLLTPPSLYASEKEKQVYAEEIAKYAPQPCDLEVADRAFQYAREVLSENQDRSDYEHNLYVATLLPAATQRTSGIAASLIPYYLKEVEKQTIKEAEARLVGSSQHFGEIGKRLDLYVKLLNSVIQIDGNYGTTYLHKFLTREGNLATWFASNCPGMEQGTEYRISATVKAHNERNGVKQTALTRVTVFTDEGRAQAEAKEAKRVERAAKKAEREAKQSVCTEQTAMEGSL